MAATRWGEPRSRQAVCCRTCQPPGGFTPGGRRAIRRVAWRPGSAAARARYV